MEITATKTTFQKYPAYKDSGVEWLGEIPANWDLLANKFVFKLKKNLVGKKSSDYTLLSLTLKGIIQRNLDNGGKFPAEFDTYQEVKKGDFIFCLFDVEETPRCVGLSDFEGMITGAYTVMEVNPKFDKAFLYYFYLNLDADKRMRPLYTGLRNTISKDNFFAFKTFVPSKEEQTAIANFLDDKTAKIDLAIAQKEQLIALLKERKQIIIQKAVTKGLDPNVKLKDSGVEWIGEIPEHWTKQRLSKHIKYQEGPGIMAADFTDSGIPLIRISGVKGQEVTLEGCNYLSPLKVKRKWNHFKLDKGDLVISGSASTELVSEVSEESAGCILYTGLIRLKVNLETLSKEYIKVFLGSNLFFTQIEFQKTGSTISHYGPSHLSNMFLILPPKKEQTQIISFLSAEFVKIEKSVTLIQTQIDKLKEYKATLIDSAVTGKIKVS